MLNNYALQIHAIIIIIYLIAKSWQLERNILFLNRQSICSICIYTVCIVRGCSCDDLRILARQSLEVIVIRLFHQTSLALLEQINNFSKVRGCYRSIRISICKALNFQDHKKNRCSDMTCLRKVSVLRNTQSQSCYSQVS